MTIVTNRCPRRKRPKQPVELKVPKVVHHTPKGHAWRAKPLPDDPEADAQVAASSCE